MRNIPTLVQQFIVPLLGAALPVIAAGKIPTDWRGWCTLFAGAVIASGLLNTTAPRNQGASMVPVPSTNTEKTNA